MKFKIIKYVGVAAWQWKGVEEGDICGICQNEFEKTCPSCRIPGKDCPLSMKSRRIQKRIANGYKLSANAPISTTA